MKMEKIEMPKKIKEKLYALTPPHLMPYEFMDELLERRKEELMQTEKKEEIPVQETTSADEEREAYWEEYERHTERAMTRAFDKLFKESGKGDDRSFDVSERGEAKQPVPPPENSENLVVE